MSREKSGVTVFLLVMALFITGVPVTANAEIQSVAEAINKAGRQRMLTQRIVRAYAQVGLNVNRIKSEKMLAGAIKLFDEQFDELLAFASTKKLKTRVSKVQKLWKPFRILATGKINKEGAQKLLSSNDDLLKACHQLVLELQDFSGAKSGRLINIAGRQRMLSQRIAKFYMLKEWGFKGAALDDGMNLAFVEFKGALLTLSDSELNSKKISLALKNAEKIFSSYEKMLNLKGVGARMKVSEKADHLLKYMNGITGMYKKLADETNQ